MQDVSEPKSQRKRLSKSFSLRFLFFFLIFKELKKHDIFYYKKVDFK